MLMRIEVLPIDHFSDTHVSFILLTQQTTMKELLDIICSSSAIESGDVFLGDVSIRILGRDDETTKDDQEKIQPAKDSSLTKDSTMDSNSTEES